MIPLYKVFMPANLPELEGILQSGKLSYGKWGRKFEEQIGSYIGFDNIASTSSYNSAMLITITILGLEAGDEVIASPMSCLASNQPFASKNLKICWADIDPYTGTLDPQSVKSKINPRTKAIFHNHFCGYVGYVDEINTIAREKGIPVIDDAIEAFGSIYKGKKMGNLGSTGTVCSFQTVRFPNTIDGGAVAFHDETLFRKAKQARDYGVDRSNFRDSNGEINPHSDITIPGYGALISEVNSYIGNTQMKYINEILSKQRNNGTKWKNILFSTYPELQPLTTVEDTLPNYWIFGLLSNDKLKTIEQFRAQGYYASGVHMNNNIYSLFGDQSILKGVEEFRNRFVALPSGWWVNL